MSCEASALKNERLTHTGDIYIDQLAKLASISAPGGGGGGGGGGMKYHWGALSSSRKMQYFFSLFSSSSFKVEQSTMASYL